MKNITIIKLGALGDVVQTASALSEYKKLYPDRKVSWVVGRSIEPLLSSMGIADHIVAIDDQSILTGSVINRTTSLIRSMFQIFTQIKYCERLYIAHSNWQYSTLAIPLILRYPVLLFCGIHRFFPRLKEYRVSEYFHFLRQGSIDVIRGNLALQSIGKNVLSNRAPYQLKTNPLKKYIALVPGGSKNMLRDDFLRRWPIDSYLELANRFIADGFEVVLVGGKSDAWVKAHFKNLKVIDLIGNTSLVDVVDIFSRATLIVSHDTGPLHLATMTATPLVAIFGPTPASAVLDINRKSLVVFKPGVNITCAPCYNGVNYAPCIDPICMKSTSVDMVQESAKVFLDEGTLGAQ